MGRCGVNDLAQRHREVIAALGQPESFQLLVESVRDYGIFMLSPDGLILTWTEASRRITGFSAEEVIGQPVAMLYPLEGDGAGEAAREFETATAQGCCELAGWRSRKESTPYWAFVVTTALRDAGGELRGFAKIIRDDSAQRVTDARRQVDLDGLRRSNQDLEAFAAVASHDLQEPLRKILSFGERLSTRFGASLPDVGRDYLARMLSATQRMQQLIDALLVYSRIAHERRAFARVALDEVARQVLTDLDVRIAQVGASVEVGALPAIDADPMQMRQLLQNLISNGLKFHRPDVPPVVRVRASVDVDAGTCTLTVQDEGIGFEPEYAERIFGVFQRLHTRDVYEGTGIGLAVCRQIAERHGGHILAIGLPGRGARFIVTLPIHQPRAEEPL